MIKVIAIQTQLQLFGFCLISHQTKTVKDTGTVSLIVWLINV